MSNPTDPVRDYEEALAKLADAEKYVEGLVRSLEGVLGRLRLWKQVVVLGHEGRFSEEMRKSERRSEINARDGWPSTQDIVDALGAWHQAGCAACAAWERLPPERRTGQNPSALYPW